MYQALAILHQGSMAFEAEEPVLHYQRKTSAEALKGLNVENEDNEPKDAAKNRKSDLRPVIAEDSGIAWDDVMRCLGSSFPSVRLRLEAIWWMELHSSFVPPTSPTRRKRGVSPTTPKPTVSEAINTDPSNDSGGDVFLAPEYAGKRLLLGPVDFFRLFVPSLPETAVPEGDSSRNRMEQMLRWRKRVARASVLVQAYTRAKTVSNRGWNIARNIKLPENYLKRRLAFDNNTDNKLRDAAIKNEYYEATVSRDVVCQVRGLDDLKNHQSWWRFGSAQSPPATMSLYQGFSLVGVHAFEWPGRSESGIGLDDLPLQPHKDPVQSIPSLRALIAAHPELDFFVHTYFPDARKVALVHCYVRSLPRGVDNNFDTVVSL